MRRRRLPLSGLRVLDASRVLAGPYLAMLLGDLGAGVVKVERPGVGDQTRAWGPPFVGGTDETVSAYFVSANRNKRSLALDLKTPLGRDAFRRLLGSADVLVENFLPGEWRKLGFRSGRFGRAFPRLVQCTVSGFASSGPDADRPAYDVVLQGETGLMSLTGFPGGEPVRVGVAIVDILSALYGLSAVLAALRQREATGRGCRVEISMADAGTSFLSYAAQSWLADGRQPARLGSAHPNLAPYQAFAAKDGWFLVGVGSDELWRRFCAALAQPELASDARFAGGADRLRNRVELEALLGGLFARHTRAYWDRTLRRHGVPAGPVNDVGTAVRRAAERGQVVGLPAGAYGELSTVAAPFLFDGRRLLPQSPPPAVGEHTIEVLREAGMTKREIEELIAQGAAATPAVR
jgi:formyl-CoA transferase/CoA:oxalate CoA-transferase